MLKKSARRIVFIVALTAHHRPCLSAGHDRHRPVPLPDQAQGSLIEHDGKVVGSALIGQVFTSDKYFHGRPSATLGPTRTTRPRRRPPLQRRQLEGSNLGPTNKALIDRVKGDVDKLKAENPLGAGPDRPGDHVGQRPRPAHLAGGGPVPGAARCQGAQPARRSRARAGRRPDRGPAPRPPRRAARQRAGAQPRARRGSRQVDGASRSAREARRDDVRISVRRPVTISGPRPRPCSKRPRREEKRVGKLKIFVGAAPGVGKTYEMLQPARARQARRLRRRRRRRRDPRPQGDRGAARGPGGHPAQAHRLQGPCARGDGPRRHPRAPAADRAGRRARPHQRAGQPPPQALSRRRGAARQRHRRLHHRQHPARREPQRRRRADHPRPRARDRARLDLRPRRRHRARSTSRRRPDPAAEGRQGLRPQAGRAGARAFLLARQPDGAARARAAPHRRAGRRAVAHPHAGARHPGPVGGGRARPGLRQRGPARRRPGALRQAARRPAARAVDCALRRDAARSLQLTEEERDRIADTLRLAEPLGGEAITIPGGAQRIADDVIAFARRPTTSPRSSSASRRARAGSRSCTARSCTTSSAARQHQRPCHRRRRASPASRCRGRPCARRTRPSAVRARPLRRRRSSRSRLPSASASSIQPWLGIENVDLVFLTAIVGVAVRFGLWPSLFASVAASLCYNFFFLPPLYTFTIADPTNVAAFVFFAVMAMLVSNVAARVRTQALAAIARARTTEVALRLQPQARRRRHARRRAVGDRLPDRLDAEGPGRAAAAGGRLDRGQGRLSAGGHARRGRPRRRQLGLAERPRGRARLRHAARRQAAVPADAHRPRRRSASSASTATSRARCSRPTSGACSMR